MRVISTLFFVFFAFLSLGQNVTASFSVSSLKVCAGGTLKFTNSSSGSIKTSTWDFADGQIQTLSGVQGTSHIFNSPGKYEVSLTIISTAGGSDNFETIIEVLPFPKLDFSIEGNKCELPAKLNFTNNSPQIAGINYKWNFGNGQSNNLFSPGEVTYSSASKYNISISTESSIPGCETASLVKTIQIYDFRATISGKDLVCAKDKITLVAKANMPVDNYSWDLKNGKFGENNDTTSTEYLKAGSYVVDLAITNNAISCTSHAYYKVTIKPLPAPSFTVNTQNVCPTFSVSFTNTSVDGSNFLWDFGDGTTYSGKDPGMHTYSKEGEMNVSLSSKSSNGCFGTTVYSNFVHVFNPKVNFVADSSRGCTLLPVQFTDKTISNDEINNPVVKWDWDFGNGVKFSGKQPPLQKYDVGRYDVKLTVTTKLNCIVPLNNVAFIRVGKVDGVNFTSVPMAQCAKQGIKFTDASTILASHTNDEVTYNWLFGNEGNAIEKTPTFAFKKDTGYFDVKLIIDFRGCKDSIIKKNTVKIKAPIALFEPENILFCNPINFPNVPVNNKFIDKSKSGKLTDNIDVEWTFDDGQKLGLTNVDISKTEKGTSQHNYSNYKTYKVIQKVTNHTTGCVDTTLRVFHISWVKSKFNIENDSVCQRDSISFEDKSTSFLEHPLKDWQYNTGENTNVKGANVKYAYTSFGKLDVSLTSTNNVGCSDEAIFNGLNVLRLPKAEVFSEKDTMCAPNDVKFINSSKIQSNGVALKKFDWFFSVDKSNYSNNSVNEFVIKRINDVGRYYATMKVTDVFGCVSDLDTGYVFITKPASMIDLKSVVCNEELFTVYNKTTNWVNNTWFVDGQFIAKDKDSIKYIFKETTKALVNTHSVKLISLDKKGCIDSLRREIKVSMPKIDVQVVFKGLADTNNTNLEFKCPPVAANYLNLSQSIGSIDSSKWVFTNNSRTSVKNPYKVYSKPGLYTTTLHTVDEYGCFADTILKDFMLINGPKCYPTWTSMGDVCGQSYQFELKNLENTIKIEWDLGDNTFLNDSLKLKHSYLNVQTYKPTVKLTDSEGCSVVYLMEEKDSLIVIPDTGLKAEYLASDLNVKLGQLVYLTDNSSTPKNNIVSWKWNYGNNDSIVFNTPAKNSIRYNKFGEKEIVLTITDADGCSDQDTKTVSVINDYDVPNVLTPNNDGVNDELVLFDNIFKYYSISMFNRWGNKVYELKDAMGVLLWNGSNKDHKMCEDGAYFYNLEGTFEDGTLLKKSGAVTLINTND